MCLSFLIAQSVSKDMATRVALQYMKNDICNAAPSDYALLTKGSFIDTTYTHLFSLSGKAPLYLVQMPEGWVLVSSEYVKTPILASAPTGQFPDTTDMPDGMKWLLSYYEDAIQYTRDNISVNIDSIKYIWEHRYDSAFEHIRDVSSLPASYEIDSIRSFKWNQSGNNGAPPYDCEKVYNKFCPTWYNADSICNRTFVGCVAVAMGLIMRHHRWPYSAVIPDTIDTTGVPSSSKHIMMYSWNNMPTAINNSTDVDKVNEIAELLRDCGYSCRMEYGPDGSAAYLEEAKDALNSVFHYKNATYHRRNSYVGNWVDKLKTEIAADRPVLYGGNNNRGLQAHAFVLYGYTSENKFIIHFGWGENDANDGYYSLDSIMPNNHIYNYNQDAVWGIEPDYPNCGTTYNLQQSDVNVNNFEIYRGGAVSASNITINNNRSGVIFSGESVALGSGFKIEAGSHVVIDVKDMHCDERVAETEIQEEEYNSRHAPQWTESYQITSTANKILRDGHIYIFRDGKVYSIIGLCVR